jgi:hypothetical protein
MRPARQLQRSFSHQPDKNALCPFLYILFFLPPFFFNSRLTGLTCLCPDPLTGRPHCCCCQRAQPRDHAHPRGPPHQCRADGGWTQCRKLCAAQRLRQPDTGKCDCGGIRYGVFWTLPRTLAPATCGRGCLLVGNVIMVVVDMSACSVYPPPLSDVGLGGAAAPGEELHTSMQCWYQEAAGWPVGHH